MKKIKVLVLVLFLIILTGCGEKKAEELELNKTYEFDNIKYTITNVQRWTTKDEDEENPSQVMLSVTYTIENERDEDYDLDVIKDILYENDKEVEFHYTEPYIGQVEAHNKEEFTSFFGISKDKKEFDFELKIDEDNKILVHIDLDKLIK